MSMMDYNHTQARKAWNSVEIKQTMQGAEPEERYRSAYEQERDELGNNLVFLEAVIDTLYKRLHPVMIDAPSRTMDEKLGRSSSPVVAAFNDANQRVNRCAMNLQDLLERLEI